MSFKSLGRRPDVWSVFIAAVAMILSQLPPIPDLLQGPDVRLNINGPIALSHYLGYPVMETRVDIWNEGGLADEVAEILIVMDGPEDVRWKLQGAGFATPSSPQMQGGGMRPSRMGMIRLKPGQQWGNSITFQHNYAQIEDSTYWDVARRFHKPVSTRDGAWFPIGQRATFDAQMVADAKAFMKNVFDLRVGHYEAAVVALGQNGKCKHVANGGFELSAADIDRLKAYAEHYDAGMSLVRPAPGGFQVGVSWNRLGTGDVADDICANSD